MPVWWAGPWGRAEQLSLFEPHGSQVLQTEPRHEARAPLSIYFLILILRSVNFEAFLLRLRPPEAKPQISGGEHVPRECAGEEEEVEPELLQIQAGVR